MQPKHSDKKQAKRPKPVKMKKSRLVFIIITLFAAIAFVVFSVYGPLKNKPVTRQVSPHTDSGPAFRKDGTLAFIKAQETSPIHIDIEVADDEPERMRGLMDRFNLPENAGMLFVFPDEDMRSFWMKNTFISLDIIYINQKKEIVSIQKYTQPQTTTAIPSEEPAMYVVEVNAGFTDKYGINPGDRIDFKYPY